jgi:phosphoribosylformylglycinamidine synthase subunit PurL
VLGLIEDAECAVGSAFRNEGDVIVLLDAAGGKGPSPAEARKEFSSTEYAKAICGVVAGAPPAIDLGAEKRLIECLVRLASEKAILSAHDVSDGGLAVTIAESCFGSQGLSADVNLGESAAPAEVEIFGERGSRAVVSLSRAWLARVNEIAAQYKVKARQIGSVTRGEFRIQFSGSRVVRGDVGDFRRVWSEALGKVIEGA